MKNLSLNCPHCRNAFEVPQHLASATLICPACRGRINLKSADAATPPPVEPRRPPAATRQESPAPVLFACDHCGVELEADAYRADSVMDCPNCNASICVPPAHGQAPMTLKKRQTAKHCPQCGATMPMLASFCPQCGSGGNATAISINRPPVPSPMHHGERGGLWDSIKLVFAILLFVGIAGSVIFYFMHHLNSDKKGEDAKAPPSPVSSLGSLFSSGKEDDQRYDHAKTKASHAASPEEKVEALQGYLTQFPSGRHSGEITALLEDAKKEAAKPRPFNASVVVRAFTMKGSNSPRHSITYELLVNGEKVRTMDNSSVSAEFGNVTIKPGDVLSGRALWRNGYGTVGTVHETPREAMHTVVPSDKGRPIYLQTFEGIYLEGWW